MGDLRPRHRFSGPKPKLVYSHQQQLRQMLARKPDLTLEEMRPALVPTLRPGDIVIMDNLSPHKSQTTLALIAQAGAQSLFLPAYSPDLNPIEKMWSKVKGLLRAAEARTPEDLIIAIGQALARVTPQDALGWFTSCGYRFC